MYFLKLYAEEEVKKHKHTISANTANDQNHLGEKKRLKKRNFKHQ